VSVEICPRCREIPNLMVSKTDEDELYYVECKNYPDCGQRTTYRFGTIAEAWDAWNFNARYPDYLKSERGG